MATYNRVATLPRAVDSVLGQSLSDLELIIVDDGSTDETAQYLAGLNDPRIRVHRHAHNRGVTAAKNTGLDDVRGDWFTFLDSDDEMTPEALSVMVACAVQTGATAVTCNCANSVTGAMTGIGPTCDGWLVASEAARCRGEHWGLTRTSLLGDMRFDERLPSAGQALWLKIHSAARRYYIHRALRVYHTEGADRVTAANRQSGLRDRLRIFSVIGEDGAYLRALKRADARRYRRTMRRVRSARLLRWAALI